MDHGWCHGDVCGDIINRFSAHHADSTTGKGVLIKLTRSAIIIFYKQITNDILFFQAKLKINEMPHGDLNTEDSTEQLRR
jgi:hypothetical protein